MAILKPRTKLISFRLSEEEYEKLQGACVAEGARSISEFARAALQRSVGADNNHSNGQRTASFGPGAQELVDTMRELSRHLSQLVSLVRSQR